MNNKDQDLKDQDPTEGIDEIVGMPREFKDVNGVVFEAPIPNWGMELQVIKALGRLLKEVKSEIDIPLNEIQDLAKPENRKKLNDVIYILMEKAPEEITKIVAKIIDREEEFVTKNLDVVRIIEILAPFFLSRMGQLTKSMAHMDKNFERLMQGLQGSQFLKKPQKKART